jgi:hypothetical protein
LISPEENETLFCKLIATGFIASSELWHLKHLGSASHFTDLPAFIEA